MSGSLLDKVVKFNSQSSGRDKVFRVLQYGSRIVWAYFEKCNFDKDAINKFKNLEYSLSTARKLYRLGRGIDIFYGALQTINLEDPALRYTITLSRINMALFFLADHMLWIERVGLARINKQKWARISYRLWLYYLTMNLFRDLYEILRIVDYTLNRQCSAKGLKDPLSGTEPSKLSILYRIIMQHKDVAIDTLKNGCDVWIPLAQLGYVSLSPGIIGLLGVISSIAGMFPILDHTCKLTPL